MLIWFPAPRAFCGDKSFIACALMDNGTELSNCANECSNKLSSAGVQWSKNSFAWCWFCKDARPWRLSNDPDNLLFFVDDFERTTTRKTKKKRRLVVSTRVVFVANVRVLVERHIPNTQFAFLARASWAKIGKEEDSFLEERTPTKKNHHHKNRKKEFFGDLRVGLRKKKKSCREKSPFAVSSRAFSTKQHGPKTSSHLWKLPFTPCAVAMMPKMPTYTTMTRLRYCASLFSAISPTFCAVKMVERGRVEG